MKTETNSKIIEYIARNKQATVKELADFLGISNQALFRQLKKLIEKDKIYKLGKPPKVFYFLKKEESKKEFSVAPKFKKAAEDNFLIITPGGEAREGFDGFVYWCERNNLPIEKTAKEYFNTLQKYNVFKKQGLIDGMNKMKSSFDKVFLDKLYYIDFYSIERFGKTKLGQYLLYAKQSQDKKIIKDLILKIKPKIEELIKKEKINIIGFVPPTVKREVQFMKELEKRLKLKQSNLGITKIKTEIIVPQKTLNKLVDRIENAEKTFVVEGAPKGNVLLIDDAVGSGATFNEIAKKIKKNKEYQGKIIGLAITGSFKGFDVISEV